MVRPLSMAAKQFTPRKPLPPPPPSRFPSPSRMLCPLPLHQPRQDSPPSPPGKNTPACLGLNVPWPGKLPQGICASSPLHTPSASPTCVLLLQSTSQPSSSAHGPTSLINVPLSCKSLEPAFPPSRPSSSPQFLADPSPTCHPSISSSASHPPSRSVHASALPSQPCGGTPPATVTSGSALTSAVARARRSCATWMPVLARVPRALRDGTLTTPRMSRPWEYIASRTLMAPSP